MSRLRLSQGKIQKVLIPRGKEDDLSLDPKLKPFEVIEVAVRSEMDAADFYSRLYERVKNELLRGKLKFLIFEEEKHRKILEKLFSQRFSEKELQVPERSFLPPIAADVDDEASVLDLFNAALRAEKTSEEYYKEAGEKAEDETSRKILTYLSRVERSHYFAIQSEIDLLQKFPDYYNVEDFHFGQDMVHIGP
jgi:rubrerythrin